jgi:uncharacterized membrane protein
MNETFWIIAEIIAGIGILGLLSAVITAVMVPFLSKSTGAKEILGQRYARGEVTRDQYLQMRDDLGIDRIPLDDLPAQPTSLIGRSR